MLTPTEKQALTVSLMGNAVILNAIRYLVIRVTPRMEGPTRKEFVQSIGKAELEAREMVEKLVKESR